MEDIPTVFNPRLNDTREILSTRFGGSSLEESVARGNKSLISTATAFSGSAVVTHLSTSTPWSLDVSVDEYLEERNRSFAQSVFPALVVLVMLMVLGIAGNTLVLYVYTFRMKGGTITRFVQALAVFDLVSCCVAIPGEITDISKNYTFGHHPLCKVVRTVNVFCSVASGGTLVVVAIDRYKRICSPLRRQIPPKGAVIIICCCVIISSIIALPAVGLYGSRTVTSGVLSINGTDCSISDHFSSTAFPLAYIALQIVLFLIGAAMLIILYALIVRQIVRQANQKQPSLGVSPGRRRLSSQSHVFLSSRVITENLAPHKSGCPEQTNGHKREQITPSSEQADRNRGTAFGTLSMTVLSKVTAQVTGTEESHKYPQFSHEQPALNQSDEIKEGLEKHYVSPRSDHSSVCSNTETSLCERRTKDSNSVHDGAGDQTDGAPCITETIIEPLKSNSSGAIVKNSRENLTRQVPALSSLTSRQHPTQQTHAKAESSCRPSDSPLLSLTAREVESHGCRVDRNTTAGPLLDLSAVRKQIFLKKSSAGPSTAINEPLLDKSTERNNSLRNDFWPDNEEFHRLVRRRSSLHGLVDIKNLAIGARGSGIRRTTLMLFLITIVYLVSFLPHLTLMTIKVLGGSSPGGHGGTWVNLLIRSYFVNNAANPFIYSFFSRNFFRECKNSFPCIR